MRQPRVIPVVLVALLMACGTENPTPPPAPAATAAAAAPATDWSRCAIPGLITPVPGRLFVIDGGATPESAEPGRETIRRVDILVPGDVALLLTARDATAWHVRPSPDTRVVAVYAAGETSQRITGERLGPARLVQSGVFGDPCGRYWLAADAPLDELTNAVFGRPHDALYRIRIGEVVIGGAEGFEPDALGPGR